MLIQEKINDKKGMFYVEEAGEILAEMDISLSPSALTILHTEVDEKLKGKNVGLQLVNYAAEYARSQQLIIIPLCPFAKAVFDKRRDEYTDVLKAH